MSEPYRKAPTTTAVAAASVSVLSEVFEGEDVKQFVIYNSGSAALTACSIQSSPDGTHWEVRDAASAATLAAGAVKSVAFANDFVKYWRIMATAAASPNNTTIVCYSTGKSSS